MKIVLASKSPIRKALFKTLYDNFEVIDSNFDESAIKISSPRKLVQTLAVGKCENVYNSLTGERLVVGADTVISINDQIYGKPKDENDARRMIKSYSGKTNKVYTGVCVMAQDENGFETKIAFSVATTIKFRKIYDEEIEKFIESKEYENVAGACKVEGYVGKFIDKIIGSYNNIMGLPVSQLYQALKEEHLI